MVFEWTTELVPQSETSPSRREGTDARSYRPIKRRGRSVFEKNECWGYDKFYPLEQLEAEGFISPHDGSLLLRFAVRPASHVLHARLMQWQILQREKEVRSRVGPQGRVPNTANISKIPINAPQPANANHVLTIDLFFALFLFILRLFFGFLFFSC